MRLELFSNPFEGNFPALADAYTARIFRSTLDAVNKFADQIGAARLPIGAEVLTPRHLGVNCWKPEIGSVVTGMRAGVTRDDWSWVSGQMMLAAYLNDLVPSLDLEITGRHPVAIAGHVVHGDRLRVVADAETLTVKDGSGEVSLCLTKVKPEGIAPVWARNRDQDVVRLGSGSIALLAKGDWVDHWKPPEAPVIELTPDLASSRQLIDESMAVLERHLPAVYLWVALVLRELVLLDEPGPKTPISQSFVIWPAQVQISRASLLKTILMLVHECSHQYFNILLWCGPLVKDVAPDDYSAIKRTNRPLERILLGYHAFANILLTLPLLRGVDAAITDREIEEELQEYGPMVADLDGKLRKHEDEFLEPAGKALYLPLQRRLAAADPVAYASA